MFWGRKCGMELIERDPLPAVCRDCQEPDCWECDYAGKRWIFSEEDQRTISRKMKERAIARCQRLLMERREKYNDAKRRLKGGKLLHSAADFYCVDDRAGTSPSDPQRRNNYLQSP